MIDITLQNFEADLLAASMNTPVLLDIWAPWCGPCKSLGPVLEKLETEYAGRFTLAKLNSDEQPEIAGQLSQAFGVRSIPFCVMFIGGQPVDGFVGALPEAKIREFLAKHVPDENELAAAAEVAEAEALLEEGATDDALAHLAAAVQADPKNEAARFDWIKALIEAGRVAEAQEVFAPVAAQAADTLIPHPRFAALAVWLQACTAAQSAPTPEQLQAAIAANKRDFEARYRLAQTHFAAARFTEAMDELLEIVMRDKGWNDSLARKTFVAVLEVLTKPQPKPSAKGTESKLQLTGHAVAAPSDPLVDQYRRKLSMALF
ncbi:putative thioredoxin [Inhella inkyongensis]|uniref:Putative thioredoxin n=1 Tax=Inhella inkyongensis TaxID=392593 RepID=A0A840S110_9BURK|nr:tetratricopeptide repeat protein [Inhella inkyongensis]MBB5203088.1 putative thioredoxin [Inhella inkyongensis]